MGPVVAAPTREEIQLLDATGVSAWAISIGIKPEHAAKLEAGEVDGRALLLVTRDDLTACGIPIGPSLKIMAALQPYVYPG